MNTESPALTANQLVAYNLRRAREHRGLTQPEASKALKPYLGRVLSVASLSVAENSYRPGTRGRQFHADEILAFAQAFDVPVQWFWSPPDDEHLRGAEVRTAGAADGDGLDEEGQLRLLVGGSEKDQEEEKLLVQLASAVDEAQALAKKLVHHHRGSR